MEKWSEEKAWSWYHAHPWIRGCNFIGSDCANRRDQWQSYGRKERMQTAEREIALAEKIGFNSVRLIMDFDVWLQEPESYFSVLEELERLEFLQLWGNNKISDLGFLKSMKNLKTFIHKLFRHISI